MDGDENPTWRRHSSLLFMASHFILECQPQYQPNFHDHLPNTFAGDFFFYLMLALQKDLPSKKNTVGRKL